MAEDYLIIESNHPNDSGNVDHIELVYSSTMEPIKTEFCSQQHMLMPSNLRLYRCNPVFVLGGND